MLAQATRTFALSASALVLMTAAAVANPGDAADSNTSSTLVRYHDLDLNTDAGVAALRARIAKAAARVCALADGRTLADKDRFAACRDSAIAGASPQMNAVIASVRSSDHRYAMTHDAIAMLGR
jgi:UrcA family protein